MFKHVLHMPFSDCGLFWVLVAGGIWHIVSVDVGLLAVSLCGAKMCHFLRLCDYCSFFQSCAFDVFPTYRHRRTFFISLCVSFVSGISFKGPTRKYITLYVNGANEKRRRLFAVCARVVCSHAAV